MYIAFKWLAGLTFTMWIAVCLTDVYLKRHKENISTALQDFKPFEFVSKNVTQPVKNIKERMMHDKMDILHGAIFIAGALVMIIFNKKNEIINFTKTKLSEFNIRGKAKKSIERFYTSSVIMSVGIVKYISYFWGIIREFMRKTKTIFIKCRKVEFNQTVHFLLLKKLKDIGEERKNLGQLLIAAIHENKNLRMHYQLETMAKSRLARHIEDTHKLMKENKSRYVSFQQLYLITHQENVFLKARIRKLIKEKDEAANNLMEIMNEIYKSKNTKLKAFCSRFIVKTKNNLLNTDVNSEIQKFLKKSSNIKTCTTNLQFSQSGIQINCTSSCPKCTSYEMDILQNDGIAPLASDAPKLKGLPGEYVWTVKDRNGIIEKLYEYDYDSDYDNGDIIRRIRQYSVYYDKDCLLDFSNSKTVIRESSQPRIQRNCSLNNQRFLTSSEAFQRFLKYNGSIVGSAVK